MELFDKIVVSSIMNNNFEEWRPMTEEEIKKAKKK